MKTVKTSHNLAKHTAMWLRSFCMDLEYGIQSPVQHEAKTQNEDRG